MILGVWSADPLGRRTADPLGTRVPVLWLVITGLPVALYFLYYPIFFFSLSYIFLEFHYISYICSSFIRLIVHQGTHLSPMPPIVWLAGHQSMVLNCDSLGFLISLVLVCTLGRFTCRRVFEDYIPTTQIINHGKGQPL